MKESPEFNSGGFFYLTSFLFLLTILYVFLPHYRRKNLSDCDLIKNAKAVLYSTLENSQSYLFYPV